MKYLRKPLSAFLSFVLTCNLCPVLPAHARAAETPFAMSTDVPEEGEAASGQSTDETAYGDTTDEEVESGRWQALQELIVRSEDGATITLDQDYAAGADDAGLVVPAGKSVTLDLAGHTLDRGLSFPADDGYVIAVCGELTIVDGTAGQGADATGTITGGNTQSGGGILVGAGATLALESGAVRGNAAVCGAGIYVSDDATLRLAGGRIEGNVAADRGGGVLVDPGASAVIVEGEPVVWGNDADTGGGDVYLPSGFRLTVGDALSPDARLGVALEGGPWSAPTVPWPWIRCQMVLGIHVLWNLEGLGDVGADILEPPLMSRVRAGVFTGRESRSPRVWGLHPAESARSKADPATGAAHQNDQSLVPVSGSRWPPMTPPKTGLTSISAV